MLARGFWRWDVVRQARRLVVCRSSTCAALMVERWPDFPWETFVAGVTVAEGVGVLRRPASEALVTGDRWASRPLAEVADLGPADLVVKSANAYDGANAGVLLGHRAGYGTMARIYRDLEATGEATGCPARVLVPMLSEKLVPPGELRPSGYPDTSLGWASRFFVYRPDLIFDERDALRVLTGCEVRIVGRGATLDGLSLTTYHAEVPPDRAPALFAAVDAAKGAEPLPFDTAEVALRAAGTDWGRS